MSLEQTLNELADNLGNDAKKLEERGKKYASNRLYSAAHQVRRAARQESEDANES